MAHELFSFDPFVLLFRDRAGDYRPAHADALDEIENAAHQWPGVVPEPRNRLLDGVGVDSAPFVIHRHDKGRLNFDESARARNENWRSFPTSHLGMDTAHAFRRLRNR